jgi:hypothetical protein
LSPQQLSQLRQDRPEATRLDVAAVDSGLVSEEAALRALGEEVGIPFVDLEQQNIDLSLLRGFPLKLIHRHALFPIQRQNGTLTVATSDPFDLYPLDELSATTGLTIEPVLAQREQIARQIKSHLGVGSETIDDLLALQEEEDIQLLGGSAGSVGCSLGERNPARGDRVAGKRRAHRVAGGRHQDPLPHRRHAAPAADPAGDQPVSSGHHQPSENHGPAEHRRKAPAAGRAYQAPCYRPGDRRSYVGYSDAAR